MCTYPSQRYIRHPDRNSDTSDMGKRLTRLESLLHQQRLPSTSKDQSPSFPPTRPTSTYGAELSSSTAFGSANASTGVRGSGRVRVNESGQVTPTRQPIDLLMQSSPPLNSNVFQLTDPTSTPANPVSVSGATVGSSTNPLPPYTKTMFFEASLAQIEPFSAIETDDVAAVWPHDAANEPQDMSSICSNEIVSMYSFLRSPFH
jgi:hypothetical protein